jgi:hypothetical protein
MVLTLLAGLFVVTMAHAVACELPDNGTGTIDLPPACPDGYAGPMSIISGLPPGTTIEIEAVLRNFTGVIRSPGGGLGGEVQTWYANLEMSMRGTGMLAGYVRLVVLPVYGETQSAPRVPGQPIQSFVTDLYRMQGQIIGDPDFDLLRVTGGTDFGMPSPGQTTLTFLPSGNWNVDSFFDITYRIDFIGAPGGILAGMSGSTPGISRFQAGQAAPVIPGCYLPDNGTGTVDLPPNCPDGYAGHMAIVNGLPPLTTIEIHAVLRDFTGVVRTPGGGLGGETQTWNALLEMSMTGTGMLFGYSRFVIVSVHGTSYSAPRLPGQPVQSFDTELFELFGEVTGDPDFNLLRVTAGAGLGLPSPGHTTLTLLPGGPWNVDSFFDITYRIDFIGAPGGPVAGMSGSTTATSRFVAGQSANVGVDGRPSISAVPFLSNAPNPTRTGTVISYEVRPGSGLVTLDILDVGGRVVRTLARGPGEPGLNRVEWNGLDDQGGAVVSGVYYCRMRTPGRDESMKIVVMK